MLNAALSPSVRSWKLPALLVGAVTLLAACSDSASVRATRSLRGASDVSVFCATRDSAGNLVGRPLASCPDVDADDGETRHLYSLATQKETGEVALVDMSFCADGAACGGRVLDSEITQPGTNFLPVGAEPVSVVSTPGGMASFVAVAEPGKEGLFALATSCVGPRPEESLFRDLRTWPACRLPVAPGSMEVLVDRERTAACDGGAAASTLGNAECPADLSKEFLQEGRAKLAVALPSLGQIAILDAQALLDLPQGSFAACPIERTVQLQVELPEVPLAQTLPADLAAGAQCLPRGFEPSQAAGTPSANPSDFALRDGKLYVSDFDAPVVHILDVNDPCSINELPPLLPRSLLDPGAAVTTRKVAASPLTPAGKQYVYAIDNTPGPLAGSVMVFDVSRESGQRTPLVRPRSALITSEAPDRLQFEQEASDIEFAVQDFPEADRGSGVAVEGVQCEPSPQFSSALGALYRPNIDEALGASPSKLRGAFAFIALHSGLVVTIDIEDLDAPCRRPRDVNPSAEADLHGCVNDPYDKPLFDDGVATVSDELSCNISLAHRPRPSRFFLAQSGGSAPALRAFPQLRDKNGTSLAVDQSESGRARPRLLAVNRSPASADGGDAAVHVSATLYRNVANAADRLVIDPSEAERNSLILPYDEPRAYVGDLVFAATYEGAVRPLSDGLFVIRNKADLALPDAEAARLTHDSYVRIRRGPNANFCDSGIEDDFLIRDRADQLLPAVNAGARDEFAARYADYVDITAELLPADNPYWDDTPGRSCGENVRSASDGVTGQPLCELVFGSPTLPNTTRELRVVRAFNDELIVEPRRFASESERENILDLVACCFPENVEFRVRASEQWVVRSTGRFPHDVGIDAETLACVRDCNPLVQGKNARVFELSCESADDCQVSEDAPRVVGPAAFGEEDARFAGRSPVCVLDGHPAGGVQPGQVGSECIYNSLTSRFAIYRGLSPSERDMQFVWSVVGSFTPLSVDLLRVAGLETTSSPEKLTYVPSINRLLVADGGSTGLLFIGLRRSDGAPGFAGSVAF